MTHGDASRAPASRAPAVMVIIGLAMYKVRLIGIHFMDLRVAPHPLRPPFEAYVLAVFTTLVALDLLVSQENRRHRL